MFHHCFVVKLLTQLSDKIESFEIKRTVSFEAKLIVLLAYEQCGLSWIPRPILEQCGLRHNLPKPLNSVA